MRTYDAQSPLFLDSCGKLGLLPWQWRAEFGWDGSSINIGVVMGGAGFEFESWNRRVGGLALYGE